MWVFLCRRLFNLDQDWLIAGQCLLMPSKATHSIWRPTITHYKDQTRAWRVTTSTSKKLWSLINSLARVSRRPAHIDHRNMEWSISPKLELEFVFVPVWFGSWIMFGATSNMYCLIIHNLAFGHDVLGNAAQDHKSKRFNFNTLFNLNWPAMQLLSTLNNIYFHTNE